MSKAIGLFALVLMLVGGYVCLTNGTALSQRMDSTCASILGAVLLLLGFAVLLKGFMGETCAACKGTGKTTYREKRPDSYHYYEGGMGDGYGIKGGYEKRVGSCNFCGGTGHRDGWLLRSS